MLSARKMPHRLFWKILGVFLVAMLSALLLNIYLTRQLAELELDQHEFREHLQEIAQQGANRFEMQGRKALKQWARDVYQRDGLRFILMDEDGIPLAFPVRSAHPDTLTDTAPDNRRYPRPLWMRLLQENTYVTSASGAQYELKVLPSPYIENIQKHFDQYHFLRPLSTLVIIVLASWWLSRHLAQPVRALTRASQQLAEGSLETRVTHEITSRSDELGVLATSFNQMATRIEQHVTHQQQLLRDISHELRTPLTRQQLAIALLREEGANTQWLDKLERQNQILNALIESVLTLNRLQEQQSSRPKEFVDLTHCLTQWCEDASVDMQNKGLILDCCIEQVAPIHAHELLLQRAFDNLLNNAIKYSPQHSKICVKLKQQDKVILIQVEDEGPGVPEAMLEKLFTPFFRTDEARSSEMTGFGLGLSISREIILQQGGTISLNNMKPRGFQATIRLPQA